LEEISVNRSDGEVSVEAFSFANHVRVVVPVEFVAFGDDYEK
jgi:hypothetical protein